MAYTATAFQYVEENPTYTKWNFKKKKKKQNKNKKSSNEENQSKDKQNKKEKREKGKIDHVAKMGRWYNLLT